MKIGLVGWGVETQSAYRYFGPTHDYVIGNEEPRDDFPTGDNIAVYSLNEKRTPGLVGNVSDLSYLEHYDDCDLVIFQGAARKNLEKKFDTSHPFWAKAKTTLDIFFELSPTKNTIGVTGTKGKGTTTSLIYEMLRACGKDAHIAGNIGIPILDMLPDLSSESWVVLELSNFQLYKFGFSPHIAVHLMMVPEHIEEWHHTMQDYVEAKRNIFSHQNPDDLAIYLPTNAYSTENVAYTAAKKIPYMAEPGAHIEQDTIVIEGENIIPTKEVGLIGAHNLQNICAALTAVWQVDQNIPAIQNTLRAFTGLEHRLQLVRELDGVRYYDDSFGTVPNTAQVALDAFAEPKVVIIGGHDKGNDWGDLIKRLASDDIRHIILIGSITEKIRLALSQNGFDAKKLTSKADGNSWTMPEIVKEARRHAQNGDVVLLSTGCASFGLFKDYKDRGEQFIAAVRSMT